MKGDIKKYLKTCLGKKVRVNLATIISFLLMGTTALSLENGEILGEKYKYLNNSFYKLSSMEKIKVNYITDNIIEIEGNFFNLETGQEISLDTLSNYNGEFNFSNNVKVNLFGLKDLSSFNTFKRSSLSFNTLDNNPTSENGITTSPDSNIEENQEENSPIIESNEGNSGVITNPITESDKDEENEIVTPPITGGGGIATKPTLPPTPVIPPIEPPTNFIDFIANHAGNLTPLGQVFTLLPIEEEAFDPNKNALTKVFDYENSKPITNILDINNNYIADIFEPNGDWDDDGILNKNDEDWDGEIDNNSRGRNLAIDTSSLVNLDENQETTITKLLATSNQLDETILGKNGDFDGDGILNKNDSDWNGDGFTDTINSNTKRIQNMLSHTGSYDYGYNLSGTNIHINNTVSSGMETIDKIGVNKGEISGVGLENKTLGFEGADNNPILANVGMYSTDSSLYNYGIIKNQSEKAFVGQVARGDSTIYNYGIIGSKEDVETTSAVNAHEKIIGQVATNSSKIYNYNKISAHSLGDLSSGKFSRETFGQYNGGGGVQKAYNYGIIDVSSDDGFSYGQYSESGNLYNYGVIDVSSNFFTNGQVNFSHRASDETYNYGVISGKLKGKEIDFEVQAITGQMASGTNIYNYGLIEIENSLDSGRSYGQNLTAFSTPDENLDSAYNYGTISNEGGHSFGQYISVNTPKNSTSEGNIFNYGIIENDSTNGLSHGQHIYLSNENAKGVAYNFGVIDNSGTGEEINSSKLSNKNLADYTSHGYSTICTQINKPNSLTDTLEHENYRGVYGQYGHGKNSTLRNHGIIRVDRKNRAKKNKLSPINHRAVGMYTKDGNAYNYGTIEVYNHKNKGSLVRNGNVENVREISVGMIADGPTAEVYNFNTIKLDGSTSEITAYSDEGLVDGAAMQGINGGKVFNYGTIEIGTIDASDFDSETAPEFSRKLKLGSQIASFSANYNLPLANVEINKEIKILPEAGLDEKAIKENFIEGAISVDGLDNIVSSNELYSLNSILDKNGNVDLILKRNKSVNISDSLTGYAKEVASSLNLTNAITNSKSFLNKYDAEVSNFIMNRYNKGSLQGFVENNLVADIYSDLNNQIKDEILDLSRLNHNTIFANNSYIEGDIFNQDGGRGQGTVTNLFNSDIYKINTSILVEKEYKGESKNRKIAYDEEKVAGTIALTKNSGLKGSGLALGFSNNRLDFDKDKGKGDITRINLGYAFKNRINKFDINYGFGTGFNKNRYERDIYLDQVKRTAKSKFNSWDIGANLGISRRYSFDNYSFTPYLGVDTAYIFRDSFSEKGANGLNAKVAKNSVVSVEPKIGIHSEVELYSKGNHKLSLDGIIEYKAELGNIKDENEKISFEGFNGHYYAKDPIEEKDELTLGTNLKYKVNNLSLNVGYKTNLDSDDEVSLGFKYSW